jgi:hypothetical protein
MPMQNLLMGVKYITRDHHVIKYMLSTGFPHFEKGLPFKVRSSSLFGTGIFVVDGERAKMVAAQIAVFVAY